MAGISDDITQAYLQIREAFARVVHLRPRPADRHLFNLAEGELAHLHLSLYGMCDAGLFWHDTFAAHVDGGQGMRPQCPTRATWPGC